ncbi:hypothetical protein NKH77_07345 [Streptomyces sp. M19]
MTRELVKLVRETGRSALPAGGRPGPGGALLPRPAGVRGGQAARRRPAHAALCTAARGGTVLLSQDENSAEEAARPARRRSGRTYWDAVFLVDDVDRLAGELRARGVRIDVGIGISAVSSRMLEICDDWGNTVAFAEAEDAWRPALRRLTGRAVPRGRAPPCATAGSPARNARSTPGSSGSTRACRAIAIRCTCSSPPACCTG